MSSDVDLAAEDRMPRAERLHAMAVWGATDENQFALKLKLL